jgi:hypothetical protein
MKAALATTAVIAALALAACSGESTPGPTVTVTMAEEPVPAVTVTVEALVTMTPEPEEAVVADDPYDAYLENNPDPDLVLSREDAQLRAMLGCGTEWAPGTIDAVLQDAYDPEC